MRRIGTTLAAALACIVLAGCSGAEDTATLAEPVVSFSTTPTTTSKAASKSKATTSKENATSKAKSTTTKKKATTSKRAASSARSSEPAAAEPAPPAAAAPGPAVVLTQCIWPTQAEAESGEEFQRFCDGKWAETSFPGEGDFVWKAKGANWVSILPAGQTESGEACFNEDDFQGAPDAVREGLAFCPAAQDES